jgi:hypothetical protein
MYSVDPVMSQLEGNNRGMDCNQQLKPHSLRGLMICLLTGASKLPAPASVQRCTRPGRRQEEDAAAETRPWPRLYPAF